MNVPGKRATPLLLISTVLLCSCTIGPTYRPPAQEAFFEDRYRVQETAVTGGSFTAGAPQQAWWDQFQDPHLSKLIHQLAGTNLKLAGARERIIEAYARRAMINAGRQPQMDLSAAVTRAETGQEAVTFQGPPPGREATLYGLGAAAGWEIDLWGRIKRLVEAEDRNIQAEHEALRDLSVSLAAELALTYIEARTLETRLALLERNLAFQKESLVLHQTRERAGNGTRLARIEAQQKLQTLQSRRPELQRRLRVSLNGLDALLGQAPQGENLPPGNLPQVPSLVGIGVPAELLVRRADIRAAEQRYAASIARIGAAMAAKYPTLSLSGTFFLQSDEAGGVLDPQSLFYFLGPGLRFPLLTGNRLDSQVRIRQSQSEQARLALEQRLIVAVREVEDAATGVAHLQDQLQELTQTLASARQNRDLVAHLYRAGLESRDGLLAAEQQLLTVEEEVLSARHAGLRQLVGLYRSLGGGWSALDLYPTTSTAANDSAKTLNNGMKQ